MACRSRLGAALALIPMLLGAVLCVASPSSARELGAAGSDLREVELLAIQQLPLRGMAVLLLRVLPDGEELPIFTGSIEGDAIERALRQMRPPRPLTHELMGDVLEATGWSVARLVIDELRDDQFMAALDLSHADGRRKLVDSRPSDGIVLAIRNGASLFVAQQVIDAVIKEQTPSAQQRTLLTAIIR